MSAQLLEHLGLIAGAPNGVQTRILAFLHSCILALVQRATHGTCKLQSDKLFAFRFGLPLVAEQHRIVAKVDELMALCDRLQANLIEFRARQSCGWPEP